MCMLHLKHSISCHSDGIFNGRYLGTCLVATISACKCASARVGPSPHTPPKLKHSGQEQKQVSPLKQRCPDRDFGLETAVTLSQWGVQAAAAQSSPASGDANSVG